MPRAKRINRKKSLEELLPEFHPTKNDGQRLQDYSVRSFKRFWWICKNGHEWQARVYNRTRGTGCPVCSRKLKRSELPLPEWVSSNRTIGFGKAFRKIEEKSPGIVLVEMPVEAWENLPILTLSDEELGKLMCEYRKRKGLSQERLAGLVGYHRNYIGLIEKGKLKNITVRVYQKIMSVILE